MGISTIGNRRQVRVNDDDCLEGAVVTEIMRKRYERARNVISSGE